MLGSLPGTPSHWPLALDTGRGAFLFLSVIVRGGGDVADMVEPSGGVFALVGDDVDGVDISGGEVVGDGELSAGFGEGPDALGDEVDGVVALLKHAFDDEERLAADDVAVLGVEIREDDDVEQTVLVLEEEEGDPLGGAGALAADDEAGDLNAGAIGDGGDFRRRTNGAREAGAEEPEGMIAR